jgi:hypothetical protein
MKLRELIMMEDGEAAVATTSSDIATVAYPLFVRGKNNKEKRKNARAAVGQKYVPGPKGIGQGVFEQQSVAEAVDIGQEWMSDTELDQYVPDRLQQQWRELLGYDMNGNPSAYWANLTGTYEPDVRDPQHRSLMVKVANKWFAAKKIPNVKFFNVKDADDELEWLVQIGGPGVAEGSLTERASQLLSAQDRNGVITVVVQAPDGTKRSLADENPRYINQWLMKYDLSLPKSITSKFVGVGEAHVLNHNNVIYRLDRDNPMSDTEVAVLGGAGRYSLKALRDKARKEAAALAQDLSIEHGGAFRRSAENIKQLTNTINTIVAAYNELARLRRKGGRGSRGITDEDTNFIRECIRVVEQATQNYRLMEARAVEPDSQGYAKDSLTSPKYTVVVNTPGDLDWYKIGMYWHDKVVDPHEFGQDDSDTVMVAQGPEEYKEMMAKIKKMGLTYKEIGGTTDQPEIHSKTY